MEPVWSTSYMLCLCSLVFLWDSQQWEKGYLWLFVCSRDPFLPPELSCLVMIWGYVPSCYWILFCYIWLISLKGLFFSLRACLEIVAGKPSYLYTLYQRRVLIYSGKVVLFDQACDFRRNAHGAVREKGDTCPASHISRITLGDQWVTETAARSPSHMWPILFWRELELWNLVRWEVRGKGNSDQNIIC